MTIEADARKHAPSILAGVVMAIDPASRSAGWAMFVGGQLEDSGTVKIPAGTVQKRLKYLYRCLDVDNVDVLVIERIRGPRAHEYLHWSVGVAVAAVNPKLLFEMPVATWKKHAGKSHVKNDENDAVAIGTTLIKLAGAA